MVPDLKLDLHPDNEIMERYSLGKLSGFELDSLEEHLLVCELCQDELMLVDSYIADLKSACRVAARQPEPDRVPWYKTLFTMPRLAIAGSLAALVLAIGLPLAQQSPKAGPPAAVRLLAFRSDSQPGSARAEARRPLHLTLDLPVDTGAHRVEIVNGKGARVWAGAASSDVEGLSVDPKASFGPGLYWVRLYDDSNAIVREYRLELK